MYTMPLTGGAFRDPIYHDLQLSRLARRPSTTCRIRTRREARAQAPDPSGHIGRDMRTKRNGDKPRAQESCNLIIYIEDLIR
jgi:hypothetical protein